MLQDETKRQLIARCMIVAREKLVEMERAGKKSQAEANEHKGAMASRYDTFKEEAQYLAAGYQRQIATLHSVLRILEGVDIAPKNRGGLGAVIETQDVRYFIAASLNGESVHIDGAEFIPISAECPIGEALTGKVEGDTVHFRGRTLDVIRVY